MAGSNADNLVHRSDGARNGRRIVIHIGCDKTGTTSLQRWLCRHRRILERHSVLYPRRNLAFDGLNHTPLVAAYMPDNPDDPFLRVPGGDHGAVIASLKREIDAAPYATIVISAEHFSTRFRGDQIEALRADFAAYDCRIVLVLRDHLSRFFSGYATHVAGGGRLTPDAFADEVLLPGNIYLRYEDMVGPWQLVFGEAVTCLAYGPDAIVGVLAAAGIATGPDPGDGDARRNVSDGPDVTAALRLVNEALAPDEGAPGGRDWWRTMYVRRAIAARLRTSGQVQSASPWTLEPGRLARLEEIARHDRDWLARTMRLQLPPSTTPVVAGRSPEATAADLVRARGLVAEIRGAWTLERWRGSALAVARPLRERVRTTLDALRRGRTHPGGA